MLALISKDGDETKLSGTVTNVFNQPSTMVRMNYFCFFLFAKCHRRWYIILVDDSM